MNYSKKICKHTYISKWTLSQEGDEDDKKKKKIKNKELIG